MNRQAEMLVENMIHDFEKEILKENDEAKKYELIKAALKLRGALAAYRYFFENSTASFEWPPVVANLPLHQAHKSDAGFDIKSAEDVVIPAKDFAPMIGTKLHVAIQDGYFGLIKERSGMSSKGIFVMGGVIDSGYRGEIKVNLANMSGYDYTVKAGDRIAQLIILPCAAIVIKGDPQGIPSDRGEKGFGSSGK